MAKDQANLVGFITFKITESDYFDTKIKKYGEIIEVFVLNTHRQKGIGRMLLGAAEKYFYNKKVRWVKLQVSTFNKNAIGAYEHLGYQNRQTLLFKNMIINKKGCIIKP